MKVQLWVYVYNIGSTIVINYSCTQVTRVQRNTLSNEVMSDTVTRMPCQFRWNIVFPKQCKDSASATVYVQSSPQTAFELICACVISVLSTSLPMLRDRYECSHPCSCTPSWNQAVCEALYDQHKRSASLNCTVVLA